MDCSRIDELMVDYIYQELEPTKVELFEAHLKGCARCTQEVSAYDSTRSMLQSLPQEDPPAQISALLLQEAERAVQPPAPGFWERLRMSMRGMVMHPAMTAAVTLVMVLGISFYVYKTNPVGGDAPKVDLPLVEEGTPTATITVKEGEGTGATTTEKKALAGVDDKRAAQPTESLSNANEDERARDIFAGKTGMAQKAPPAAEPRPPVVTRGVGRTNVLGGTRGRAQAQRVVFKDGYKGVASQTAAPAPVDNTVAPTQKPVVMPPPPNAIAAGPAAGSAAAPPARRARKKARRVMGRMGAGVWDADDAVQGESVAKAPKTPPPAPRADSLDESRNKREKEGKLTEALSRRAEQVKRPRKSARYATKAKPRPRPRPTRVARRPAPKPVATPAAPEKPRSHKKKQRKRGKGKSADKQSNALNFLFAGNAAAKKGYCQSAMEHFNRALLQDRSLRTRVASAMRSCTRKMNLKQLMVAQKRHQMLAGLLESDIKRARAEQQYAARKARARKAKKTKAKKARPGKKRVKSKSSIDAFQAPSTK